MGSPRPSGSEPQAPSARAKPPTAEPPPPPTDGVPAPREGGVPPSAPPSLTAEELALIEKDPRELSVEDRRRRAYALRKKILQHPDSEAAKELERWRKMYDDGEVALPKPKSRDDPMPTLHARTRRERSP